MKYFGGELSEKHKQLNAAIRKKDRFDEAVCLFMQIHAALHESTVSKTEKNSVDALLSSLSAEDYAVVPSGFDESIAWNLWHIARIEDLTVNILINGGRQIFDELWLEKTNAGVCDTGNAMTAEELAEFSRRVVPGQLLEYRRAVGAGTREVVAGLTAADMKRRVKAEYCARILAEGGVTDRPDSAWLLDYWGGKDVAGLLLMPPTRHEILHLNSCFAIKNKSARCRGDLYDLP